MEEFELKMMNTTFFVRVSNCVISNWKEMISGWFSYVEKEWSRFSEDNELAQINGLAIGEMTDINPPLLDVLQSAEEYRNKTKGYFTPYLKKQMELNGYNHSFPFQSSHSIESGLWERPVTENPFELNAEDSSILRKASGEVDLGGVGKGYAVETAAQWLKTIGQSAFGMVDGGGDMTVWSDGSKVWQIGISHPLEEGKEIGQFTLQNASIATSNIVYRSWIQGEKQKHHILNGQTGLPVESDIIQATVVTSNCLDAEVAAKLSFMIKPSNGPEYMHKINRDLQYVLVTKNGEMIKG